MTGNVAWFGLSQELKFLAAVVVALKQSGHLLTIGKANGMLRLAAHRAIHADNHTIALRDIHANKEVGIRTKTKDAHAWRAGKATRVA